MLNGDLRCGDLVRVFGRGVLKNDLKKSSDIYY